MISCEEALALINEFIDGELEDVPYARVKAHYDVCRHCYPHLRLEESFRQAVRRAASRPHAPDDLRNRVQELLSEAGREE